MRKTILVASVAIACCGVRSSFAQISFFGEAQQPTIAPFIDDTRTTVQPEISLTDPAAPSPIPNPFDYFANGDAFQTAPAVKANTLSIDDPVNFTESNSASDREDPASLSAPQRKQTSLVDALAERAILSTIVDSTTSPVLWDYSAQPYNPTAQVMLRQWCVDGLWDNYAAERAAQCARIQSHLSGNCNCQAPCAIACAPCDSFPLVNRYLSQGRGNCAPDCNGCDQVGGPAAAAASTLTTAQPALPVKLLPKIEFLGRPAGSVAHTPPRLMR